MRMWFSSPRLFGSLIQPSPDPRLAGNLRNASEHPARLPLHLKIITLIGWLLVIYGAACIVSAIFSVAHAGLQSLLVDEQ
jgi:hypothetical protein